jgi:hypothetical protein
LHAPSQELVVLESDACAEPMKYYLRLIDAASMAETARREIPVRPMYAGFPGRSIAGCISPSGRYVYFLRSGPVIRDGDDLAFRLTPARWDRTADAIEVAPFHVDSCHVDYGLTGSGEQDLFLHLSCECASTVAFGSFSSPECTLLRMEILPSREHGPLETNGSWLDRARDCLYCANRQGTIYEVQLREKSSRVLAALRLGRSCGVPVHQITGALGMVHVGVAEESGDMGLGMVTEIWSVYAASSASTAKRAKRYGRSGGSAKRRRKSFSPRDRHRSAELFNVT